MIRLGDLGAYEKLAMGGLPHERMVGTDAADSETLVADSAAATSMAGLIGGSALLVLRHRLHRSA